MDHLLPREGEDSGGRENKRCGSDVPVKPFGPIAVS